MKMSRREYEKLRKLKRHQHHHIVHRIHKKHRISYRTLFYMKEYGPKSHVATVVIKESVKILLLASILSSMSGLALKGVEETIVAIMPLIILLPALATMIGSFGTITASRFTTMIFTKKILGKWWRSKDVKDLISGIVKVAVITSIYIGVLAYVISVLRGFTTGSMFAIKVIAISFAATMLLVGVIILISITCSLWIFKKHEDPNNFIIPITTSIADFGSIVLFSLLVMALF